MIKIIITVKEDIADDVQDTITSALEDNEYEVETKGYEMTVKQKEEDENEEEE